MRKADKAGLAAASFAVSWAVFAASGCGSGKGSAPASGTPTIAGLPTGTQTPTPSPTNPPTRQTGNAAVTISWPARSRGRLIPSATEYLVLRGVQTVNGAVTFDTTFPRVVRPVGSDAVSQTVTLPNLPVGNVVVEASAYPADSGGSPAPAALAFGTASLVVQNGQTTPLALALDSTLDHFSVAAENVPGEQNNNGANPLQLDKAEVVRLTVSARDKNDAVLLLAPDALEWRVDNNSGSVAFGVAGSGGAFGTSPVTGANVWVKGVARSAGGGSSDALLVRDGATGTESGVFVHVRDPRYRVTRLPDGFVPAAIRPNGDIAGTQNAATQTVLFRGGQIVPDDAVSSTGEPFLFQNDHHQAVYIHADTPQSIPYPYFWDNGDETRIGWQSGYGQILGLSQSGGVLGAAGGVSLHEYVYNTFLWHKSTGFTAFDRRYPIAVSDTDQLILTGGSSYLDNPPPPSQESASVTLWENGNERTVPFVPGGGLAGRGWTVWGFDGAGRIIGYQNLNGYGSSVFYAWDIAALGRTTLTLPPEYGGSVARGAANGQVLVSAVWNQPTQPFTTLTARPVLFDKNQTAGIDLNDLISHKNNADLSDAVTIGTNGAIVASGGVSKPSDSGQSAAPAPPYYLLTPLP